MAQWGGNDLWLLYFTSYFANAEKSNTAVRWIKHILKHLVFKFLRVLHKNQSAKVSVESKNYTKADCDLGGHLRKSLWSESFSQFNWKIGICSLIKNEYEH